MLVWTAAFFAFLGVVFLLSFGQLKGYILDLMAQHRLDYQTREFARHLDEQDTRSIREESDSLVHTDVISAILLVDASGRLVHVSLAPGEQGRLAFSEPLSAESLAGIVGREHNLHLYERAIPGHPARLALIMDDRPVTLAIFATTAWTALLMLALVALSTIALRRGLDRRLVAPIERVRQAALGQPGTRLDDLRASLPREAAEILDALEGLRRQRQDLHARLVEMMEVLPACFWWSDDAKVYGGVSEKSAPVLGVPAEKLCGMQLWEWTNAPNLARGLRRQLADAIEKRQQHLDLAYQVQMDGEVRWYGESLTLVYAPDGTPSAAYGLVHDISQRKTRQQQEAERRAFAHRMETTATMVGGIAHEFNNALAGMAGNVYLLRQSLRDPRDRERLERIELLIERAAGMIEQMLAFARRVPMKAETFALEELVHPKAPWLRPLVPPGVALVIETENGLSVRADRGKLAEALAELVENAVLAVEDRPTPRIAIRIRRFDADEAYLTVHPDLASRKLACIEVADNGPGVPEELRGRIFEPFFTTREVGRGTGLGLPMVHGLAHQLGGALEVDGNEWGGATFRLLLPRHVERLDPREISHEIMYGRGERILVVDDEQVFRDAAGEVLEQLGYQVDAAASGEEALDMIGRERYALVILDIVMPGLGGVETARRIRQIRPEQPILFATGYDRGIEEAPELFAPRTEVIPKPFSIGRFSQSVARLVESAEV